MIWFITLSCVFTVLCMFARIIGDWIALQSFMRMQRKRQAYMRRVRGIKEFEASYNNGRYEV